MLLQELLQGAWRHTRFQRNQLNALVFRVADLTAHVHPHMSTTGLGLDAIIEPPKESVQIPTYGLEFLNVSVLLLQMSGLRTKVLEGVIGRIPLQS